MAEVVDKFLVKFVYVLDEDTTFKYDSDCKKLLEVLQPVGLIIGGKQDQILLQIKSKVIGLKTLLQGQLMKILKIL